MTYLSRADQFDRAAVDIFAVHRSEFLDAFAELELAILRCASRIGTACDNKRTPLSVRLTRLRDTPASHRLSKAHALVLKEIASSCEGLLTVRATVVHSRMRYGTFEGIPAAFFQNVLDEADNQPGYTMLNAADFERMRLELAQCARQFDGVGPNPSSPPPP